jgi:hypothetical protein
MKSLNCYSEFLPTLSNPICQLCGYCYYCFDKARPVGEGKYAIVSYHNKHTELAFVLELPKEPGKAQKELGIEKEASYIITVINPKIPKRAGGLPTTEVAPQYPESILIKFKEKENFVPLSRNLKFIDYQNAQIILVGAREGKDTLHKN